MELLYVDNIIIFITFYFREYNKKGIKSSIKIQLRNRSVFIYVVLIPLTLMIYMCISFNLRNLN